MTDFVVVEFLIDREKYIFKLPKMLNKITTTVLHKMSSKLLISSRKCSVNKFECYDGSIE